MNNGQIIITGGRRMGKRIKQGYLKEILQLEAEAANKKAEASKLRRMVAEKFSPYAPGQFIRIRKQLPNKTSYDEIAKVKVVLYRPGDPGTIDKQWAVRVEPWISDQSRPAKNRNWFWLKPNMNIEAIPKTDKTN